MAINVGVLGCANIADRSMIPAFISLKDNFNVYAIASRTKLKAVNFAKKFNCLPIIGYDELLDLTEIDAVYIPLPTGLHKEYILKALAKEKHVICEKSITENYDDTVEVIQYAKNKQLAIVENFMFQYHSQQSKIKELLQSGVIGDVHFMKSSFGFPPFPDLDNIRYNSHLGGGALLDAGGYPLKAAQLFYGSDITLKGSHLYYDKNKNVDLWGSALFQSAQKEVSIQLSFSFNNYYQCNYEFWGTKGILKALRAFTARPDYKPTLVIDKGNKSESIELDTDDHFKNILKKFYTVIHNDHERKLEYLQILNQSRLMTQIRDNA